MSQGSPAVRGATRYPGAQPFADDELSHKLFFGREQVAADVTNQILANRLLVIYARSGLGKTSLLHAGVSPRLRQEHHLPLRVRVNDAQRALLCVREGVLEDARRQGIECVPGTGRTLWSFFKTLELWRGDVLLTPVLVLDQFEELFTLQGEESREELLDQLGHLVRGVCPQAEEELHANLKPPALRIVVSLREDYLGALEEAANQIPEILDRRFRLEPLSLEGARQAIVGPARLEDSRFASPPFEYAPEAVQLITAYLSRRPRGNAAQDAVAEIEPFQLQLICMRLERTVAARGASSGSLVTLADVGGARGLDATLRSFYVETLQSLPRRSERRLVERLCREHLISTTGQRLSRDEGELEEELGVTPELLQRLVRRRLLRTELRADSSYYELSHDALIEPVLAGDRARVVALSWVQIVGGIIVLFVLVAVLLAGLLRPQLALSTRLSLAVPLLILIWGLWASVRAGSRRMLLYRVPKRPELAHPDSPPDAPSTSRPQAGAPGLR